MSQEVGSQAMQRPAAEVATLPSRATRWWLAVDRRMEWLGDRLNPILVKETRQALKSKQFLATFTMLLLFGWAWSIFGVAMMAENAWRGTQGDDMFFGYYCILAFPLLVIVPFGAFRSLAGEQEDRTYELMSITALGPRQIIRGKLGSAVLQMIVYLSAISPCLAFTYMLRGIDFPTILFVLFYTALVSLGLAMIGLFVGTLTAEKHWQVVLSVLLVAALFGALSTCITITGEAMLGSSTLPFDDWEFWVSMAGVLCVYGAYFVLVFYAAAAQITFASDNRSTRLRVTMLAQQIVLTAWMSWIWLSPDAAGREPGVVLAFLMLLGMHWYAMGVLMIGESSELSPRVRRQLPQSFLGRVFLTWFNPGPGTGYVFAISCLLGALLLALTPVAMQNLGIAVFDMDRWSWTSRWMKAIFPFGTLGFLYIVIYLGIGLLLVRMLRKFTYVGIMLSVLLQILLLLLVCGIPWIIHTMSPELHNLDYSLVQIPSPLWTMAYVGGMFGGRLPATPPPESDMLLLILPPIALGVFLLNLPGIASEVRRVRIAKPRRVAEEDAQRLAAKHPVEPVKKSPWD